MATILTKKKDTTGAPSAGDLTNSTGGAELAVNTADKRLYTKDSGGNVVEIGTNPTSITTGTLNTSGAVVFNDAGADVDFRVEGDTDANLLFVDAGNDRIGVKTSSPAVAFDVVGQVRASTGILFGTDTAAANALDDYEEGTWTPVYVSSSGAFGAITYSVFGPNNGRYTKIGNVVYITGQLRTDSISLGTASGELEISGLPFTSINETLSNTIRNGRVSGGTYSFGAGWGTVPVRPSSGIILINSQKIKLLAVDFANADGTVDTIDPTLVGTTSNQNAFNFSGFYFTA